MAWFTKKPTVVVSSFTPVTGYQAVTSNSSIPSGSDWINATRGGKGPIPRDRVLTLIDRYVAEYHTVTDAWSVTAVLGQLYFLTNQWLKENSTVRNPIVGARQPEVQALFIKVVDQLCSRLNCSVNRLPQLLEDYWGRILGTHGFHTDKIQKGDPFDAVLYLTRAEAQKYRFKFERGLCYQLNWWDPPPWSYQLADSRGIGWADGRGVTAPRMMEPGFAGFALSMGREFYMAHHRGSFERQNFFHSSYLSGDAVLCTGTMLIEAGKVKAIKNDSGHYRPTLEHLVSVLDALQMYGVSPATVQVKAVPDSWRDSNGQLSKQNLVIQGDELLKVRGRGLGLMYRSGANQRQTQDRMSHK